MTPVLLIYMHLLKAM